MSIAEHGLLIFEGMEQRNHSRSQRRVASLRPPTVPAEQAGSCSMVSPEPCFVAALARSAPRSTPSGSQRTTARLGRGRATVLRRSWGGKTLAIDIRAPQPRECRMLNIDCGLLKVGELVDGIPAGMNLSVEAARPTGF